MNLENRNPMIYCISGKAGSGKSTVGAIIEREYQKLELKTITSPYTKYLKQYIGTITGVNVTEENKPRELLQKLSSDLIKKKLNNKDFFIRRQVEDIEFYSYFFDVIIIPDVRFPNEIEILKEKFPNVVSIRVERQNYKSKLTEEEMQDITETALDKYNNYDYIITNESKKGLESDTLKIINNLKER